MASVNVKEDCIECLHSRTQLSASEFEITETYHFDGSTDVDDEVMLYAIESKAGLKGTLVNAYGIYADSISAQIHSSPSTLFASLPLCSACPRRDGRK